MAKDEPQSYGSQNEWLEGNVGQSVDSGQIGNGESPEHQGGDVSPVQLAENVERVGAADDVPQPQARVSTQQQGAKRAGFFKDRDYK